MFGGILKIQGLQMLNKGATTQISTFQHQQETLTN